jgi:CheY-like chemotaxis protein
MTGKTILLAEDERSLRRAAEVALTRRGFRVITAVNGEEALQLARLHRPDLILLDLLMPKMTGMQVLDALRSDPATSGLRVLILSNSSRELEIAGAEALGVIDYWIKANVSLQELGDRVTKVLEAA